MVGDYKTLYEHTVLRGKVGSIPGTKPHFLRSNVGTKGGLGISDI